MNIGHFPASLKSLALLPVLLLAAFVALGSLSFKARGAEALRYIPLADQELAADPALRLNITAIAACALEEGTVAVSEVEGNRYEFPGKMGLVPHWADGEALTLVEQHWISACMLARFGSREPQVDLSLRTGEDAHAPAGPLRDRTPVEGFTLHEGGFFGNLFADQPVAFACAGERSKAEDDDPIFNLRSCTRRARDPALAALGLTDCGFRFVGFCSQIGTPEIQGVRYEEVIEVFLKPTAP